jgi:transposase
MGKKTSQRLDVIRALLVRLLAEGGGEKAIEQAMQIITQQAVRLDALLRERYGSKSEKVSPEQLQLALDELMKEQASAALQGPSSEPEPAGDAPAAKPLKAKRSATRRDYWRSLEQVEHRHTPSEAECVCEACGKMKVKIREERSTLLEYVPAKVVAHVDIMEVWACRCGDGKVATAPSPPKVIEGGLCGPGLMAQVLVAKYQDGMPLNRQLKILKRSGVDLAQSTLVDWVAAGAELLRPLWRAIMARVKLAYVVQADDTGLRVLSQDDEKGSLKGHIWAMVGDLRYVAYFYAPNWSSEHPLVHLKGRVGYLQVDGYKGYEPILRKAPEAVRVGCFMHARRPFKEALDAGDNRAAVAIDLIRKIYKIDEEAREAGDDHDARKARRMEHSVPLFAELIWWTLKHEPAEPPKSPLGKAFTYLINHAGQLMRVFEDGALELDNGAVERALRGIAVGRKSWLFAGSDAGAERAAILFTVLQSAVLHGLEPWAYLRDVLEKLAGGWLNRRLDELLPHRWAELHREPSPAPSSATHHPEPRTTNTPAPSPSSSISENLSSTIHA